MPSFPVATQTLMAKMQAGPAEPQSSSDHAPEAMSGKTFTDAWLLASTLTSALAPLRALLSMPALTGRRASVGALSPASLSAGSFCWPERTRSSHGVQWSTTARLAGVEPAGGVYFILTKDSPH